MFLKWVTPVQEELTCAVQTRIEVYDIVHKRWCYSKKLPGKSTTSKQKSFMLPSKITKSVETGDSG